jgi:hypothetical protein
VALTAGEGCHGTGLQNAGSPSDDLQWMGADTEASLPSGTVSSRPNVFDPSSVSWPSFPADPEPVASTSFGHPAPTTSSAPTSGSLAWGDSSFFSPSGQMSGQFSSPGQPAGPGPAQGALYDPDDMQNEPPLLQGEFLVALPADAWPLYLRRARD